jgi:hypothetical protein
MFLHNDFVANGKSLAGALPNLLGREEGIEDAVANVQGDTRPVVLDFDLHILVDLSGTDGELSAMACSLRRGVTDGVRGVDDQIQEDLIQLIAVAFDAGQIGLVVGLNIGNLLDLVLGDRDGCVERFV